jgi:hypothetical protein
LKSYLDDLWEKDVRAPGPLHRALVSVCNIVDYAPSALSTGQDDLPLLKDASKDEWARVRNVYTANFLRARVNSNPGSVCGLVVLAGDFHLRADKCGASRTLQACLGVGENRTFHAPFWEPGQGWVGKTWQAWIDED